MADAALIEVCDEDSQLIAPIEPDQEHNTRQLFDLGMPPDAAALFSFSRPANLPFTIDK